MVSYGGYWGKCIEVDMTAGSVNITDRHMQYVAEYIGGRALGLKMLWEALKDKPGCDPFGPENPFMLIPGVATGTMISGCSRYVAVTKSPATLPVNPIYEHSNTVAWAASGSSFSPMLKWAGYDMIYITGVSDKLKVLVINNDDVRLEDATEYSDMYCSDFSAAMQKKYGYQHKVIAVGPAAEHGVVFSSIESEGGRAAGRSGCGAVMGMKGLKGIVCYGDKAVPVACPYSKMKEMLDKTKDLDSKNFTGALYRIWGTQIALSINNTNNGHPKMVTRNWREMVNPYDATTGAVALHNNFTVRHRGCNLCSFKCMKTGVVRHGEFAGLVVDGPEYEHGVCMSGWLMTNTDDIGTTVHYIEELGVDAISMGCLVSFVLESYEMGYITKEDLGGIKAEWSNASEIVKLLKAIIFDKDHEIFAWLRKGSAYAAAKIEKTKNLESGIVGYYSMAVKNQGLPAHGIQANWEEGRGICYATSERGACHRTGNTAAAHIANCLLDCGCFCSFHQGVYGIDSICEMLNVVMGIELTQEQYNNVGEKAIHISNIFNHREGFRKEDTMLPSRVHNEPCQWGGAAGCTYPIDEFNKSMVEFYEGLHMSWETMLPKIGRLEDLGLDSNLIDYVKSVQ